MGLRNVHIGLAVGLTIIFGGVFIFRNASDEILQIVAVVGFIATFGVYHFLDERERRAERESRSQS